MNGELSHAFENSTGTFPAVALMATKMGVCVGEKRKLINRKREKKKKKRKPNPNLKYSIQGPNSKLA